MSDAAAHTPLPSDILRRVLGNLPAPKTKAELRQNLKDREALIMEAREEGFRDSLDWGLDPYPQAYSLEQLKARLDADGHSVLEDVTGPRDYTEDEIRNSLLWLIEQGYVVQDGGGYCMTRNGLAALEA